jgi:hypothetical protein
MKIFYADHSFIWIKALNGDCIGVVSKYYNEPEFSNVSINMNVEETDNYNTDDGTCFGKVLFIQLFHL